MRTTSTTSPTIEAFNKHLATCEQCRKAVDDWLAKRDPTPEAWTSALRADVSLDHCSINKYNQMKHTKSIVAILVLALFAVAVSSRSQNTKPVTSHAVVVMMATPNILGDGTYEGLTVYCASSSADAPTFPQFPHPGVQLAEAEAQLLNLGFHLERTDNFIYTWMR